MCSPARRKRLRTKIIGSVTEDDSFSITFMGGDYNYIPHNHCQPRLPSLIHFLIFVSLESWWRMDLFVNVLFCNFTCTC
jgi:hypothetical protein